MAVVGCAAAVAAIAGGLNALPRAADDRVVTPPTVVPADPDGFVPPTRVSGDRESVSLVLPDGTRVDVSYPTELALARRGWTASRRPVEAEVECCHAVARLGADPRRVGELQDARGRRLQVWTARRETGDESRSVATYVRLGHWYIQVMGGAPEGRAGWDTLRALVGRLLLDQTAEGFPTIDDERPGRMARHDSPDGDVWAEGPKLESYVVLDTERTRDIQVQRVDACAEVGAVGMELTGRQICRDGVAIRFLAAEADQEWVRQVLAGLRIDRVR
jgi:hypothetical protein